MTSNRVLQETKCTCLDPDGIPVAPVHFQLIVEMDCAMMERVRPHLRALLDLDMR